MASLRLDLRDNVGVLGGVGAGEERGVKMGVEVAEMCLGVEGRGFGDTAAMASSFGMIQWAPTLPRASSSSWSGAVMILVRVLILRKPSRKDLRRFVNDSVSCTQEFTVLLNSAAAWGLDVATRYDWYRGLIKKPKSQKRQLLLIFFWT